MRQLANYFHIAPAFRVSSVANNTLVMKSGFTADKFFTRNDIEPSEDTAKSAAGILYKFKLTAAIDKLTDPQKNFYANDAPVIAMLLDAETAEHVVIGTPDNPARVTCIPGVDHDQLVIEYSSKTPVL